ncbi:Urb2/Npa2 family-domain-containing protein [Vararia minispora EC-137]|uniref:Urb2/Npa2 family-domain-containing protein n=1 Tax=Vararia minispora EC-137 TaxID=1314806 RepID=A0ACB8QTT6_9AGAM|nr:Urb2/Npa2 family-domain-containing protein [Vararia minispora EC-137]
MSLQNFIRALRAPSDPPKMGGPLKIEIARQTWNDTENNVPSKAETITEFILTNLLKERDKQRESSVTDPRYWELLLDVIRSRSSSITTVQKTWLVPLLNRTPIAPIVVSLLDLAARADVVSLQHIIAPASAVLRTLWPLAVPKMSVEILLHCFGAFVAATFNISRHLDYFLDIGKLVSSSLRNSFNNSSNKKKLQGNFVDTHLNNWASALYTLGDDASDTCFGLYTTGRDIIFNGDTLKASIGISSAKTVVSALETSPASLALLSKLFQSFVQVLRKNQALSGQGNLSAAEIRASSMRFFASCDELISRSPDTLAREAHASRLSLLLIVENDALLGPVQSESYQTLQRLASACVNTLRAAPNLPHASIILQCLCVISRIDHDLVKPSISSLLTHLLRIPCEPHPAAISAVEFLSQCTRYHSRARSLPTLISEISTALSPQRTTSSTSEMYACAAASPMFSRPFTALLSMSVRAFVTPGQVLQLTQDLLSTIKEAWNGYEALAKKAVADYGHGPRKKARRSMGAEEVDVAESDVDSAVLYFSLVARLAASVLPALPIHTVSEDVKGRIREALDTSLQVWTAGALEISECITNRGDWRRDMWAADVGLAAGLRLLYALSRSTALDIVFTEVDGLCTALLTVARRADILPELFVEISRILLTRPGVTTESGFNDIFELILSHLESHVANSSLWTGRLVDLTVTGGGRWQMAVALLKLVLDRALLIVELKGTQDQLDRIVDLLFKSLPQNRACYEDGLSLFSVVGECLRSAQFWEQPRLRASLLSSAGTRLKVLDKVDMDAVRDSRTQSLALEDVGLSQGLVAQIAEGLTLLLYAPWEYLSRWARADILRRAVSLDMILASTALQDDSTEPLKESRTLLHRLFTQAGSADHSTAEDYLRHLLHHPKVFNGDDVTLGIVAVHYLTLMRAAENGVEGPLVTLIDSLQELTISTPQSKDEETLIEKFLVVVMDHFSLASFNGTVTGKLRMLYECVSDNVKHWLQQPAAFGTPRDVLEKLSWLRLYDQLSRFGAWLGRDDSLAPGLADKLVSLLLKSSDKDLPVFQEACQIVFQSQLSELAIVAISKRMLPENLDALVIRAMRSLSSEEFGGCLDLISEALVDPHLGRSLETVVRLGSVLLSGAPEGTLKIVQLQLTRWIQLFVDYKDFTANPLVRSSTLALVSKQCTDRPASVRSMNMAMIWSLLGRMLTSSRSHEPVPSPEVFHQIVSIVGALVRFRRDLVLDTLPHLCAVLRQLIMCLRGPRPNLGAKQYQVVADSLPSWIDPRAPLGAEESSALSRLLSTLATKNVVRGRLGPNEPQRAESLARPLSKHAAYVLQAYIETVNDPLCAMSAAVRDGLRPGLLVLCSMLNEHARDALMASGLDVAGRVAMKAVWGEYEKDRYVGQG